MTSPNACNRCRIDLMAGCCYQLLPAPSTERSHASALAVAIARSDNSFDLLTTAQKGLQYLLSEEGSYLRRQLVLALIEDDRLSTQEVQRLWNLIKDDLQPSRLVNVALSALANFSDEGAAALIPSLAMLPIFTKCSANGEVAKVNFLEALLPEP